MLSFASGARSGNFGQQLRRRASASSSPVAVYSFLMTSLRFGLTWRAIFSFEFNSGIERATKTLATPTEDVTDVQAQVLDEDFKPVGEPVIVHPESAACIRLISEMCRRRRLIMAISPSRSAR